MTTSVLSAANSAPATPLPALSALAGQAGNVPLTRVSLAYIKARFKLYLRFGEPARALQLDRWRRCAMFLPGAMLCRIRWQTNAYGRSEERRGGKEGVRTGRVRRVAVQ